MATNYPGSLDSFANPNPTDVQNSPSHSAQHTNANDAIGAIEAELGVSPSGTYATVAARLAAAAAVPIGLSGTPLDGQLGLQPVLKKFVAPYGYDGTTKPLLFQSDDGISWDQPVSPLPATATTGWGLSITNGEIIAALRSGYVYTSADASTWRGMDALSPIPGQGNTGSMQSAYGNGIYVVGGYGGIVMTSPDGSSWTAHLGVVPSTVTALVFHSGKFVGFCGAVPVTSTDGVTWTSYTAIAEVIYNGAISTSLVAGPDGLVACSTTKFYVSGTGASWTAYASPSAKPTMSLTYTGLKFAAVTAMTTTAGQDLLLSADGTSWTSSLVANLNPGTMTTDYAIAGQGTSNFVIVSALDDQKFVYTNDGGTTWTAPAASTLPSVLRYKSLASGLIVLGSTAIALGPGMTVATYSFATNVWTTSLLSSVHALTAVGSSPSEILVGVDNGHVLRSGDGLSWADAAVPSATARVSYFAYGNGIWVTIVDGVTSASSDGGVTWSAKGTHQALTVAFGAGIFVLNSYGAPFWSSDGLTWTAGSGAPPNTGLTVSLNGAFGYFTYYNTIWNSADGKTWAQLTTSGVADNPAVATVFNGAVYAAGASGYIVKWPSLQSSTPSQVFHNSALNFVSITSSGGLIIANTVQGTIVTSPNGTTWTTYTNGGIATLRAAIAYPFSPKLQLFAGLDGGWKPLT